MNTFLFSILFLSSFAAHAFESKVTFTIDEMRENSIVEGASGGNKDQMLTIAARIFQLQLEASKCEGVTVQQAAMIAASKNDFSVKSKNCVIKSKKTEECAAGFAARNISVNPRTPDDVTIGGDTYKVCLSAPGSSSGGTPSVPATK